MAEENHVNRKPAVSSQTEKSAGGTAEQQTGSGVAERERNPASNETRRSGRKLSPTARETGGELLDDAKQRLQTFKQGADEYIRKNPTKAVFTALGIGFVFGLMRRR